MDESLVASQNQHNSYILFYKRQNFNFNSLMPDVKNKQRDDRGIDDEFNTELSKASCSIMWLYYSSWRVSITEATTAWCIAVSYQLTTCIKASHPPVAHIPLLR